MKNKENNIFVTRSAMPPIEEYVDEIRELWVSHYLTNMGVKHKTFARQLKEYLSVPNIDLLVNGHMALELTIQAMNLKGEVITTPFTFASTTHAAVRNGLKPIFCDIDPNTFTIDVNRMEELITDRTCAIMPIHVYGNICNVKEIDRLAKKYGLKVIYDAAHAFGVEYEGRGIGNYGDASIFSFHATKVFNSIEGGAVSYKDKNLGNILWDLKNFGIQGPEKVASVGVNAKMNEFAAAMGICNLRHLNDQIEKRRKVVERYRKYLDDVDGIQLNVVQEGVKTNYAYFPIIIEENIFGVSRNEVFDHLTKNGINSRKYFYPLTNTFDCYGDEYDVNETPVALHISKRVLTLPLYPELDLNEVDRICEIILGLKKL